MPDLGLTDSLGTQAQAPQAATGTMDKITSLLAHPLVQGALATYLGAVSTPRYEGLGTAIGRGGLEGLSQFGQAQQLRQQLPYLQARTAGEQAGAKLAGLQAQQLQSQMAPLSADEVNSLNTLIANAKDPEEQAFFSHIKTEYQNRRLTPEEVDKHIETYNQARRQADLMKAYTQQFGTQTMARYLGQPVPGSMPGMTVSPFGSPMAGMTVPLPTAGAAPAGGSTAGGLGAPTHMLNGRPIAYSASAKHWIYTDDGSPAG